jgi:hypothetical protein
LAEQNANSPTAQSYPRTSIEHASGRLIAIFRQSEFFDFDFRIFGKLDERARDQRQIDYRALRCPDGATILNFAFGCDRLKMISFRASENDIAVYEEYRGCCRSSDAFRASGSKQETKRQPGAE